MEEEVEGAADGAKVVVEAAAAAEADLRTTVAVATARQLRVAAEGEEDAVAEVEAGATSGGRRK